MNACVWCLAVALTFVAACIVDRDDPCGDHQVKTTGQFLGCVCEPGYVWGADAKSCVKCGGHEVVREGACVCEEGFARANAAASCEASDGTDEQDAGEPDAAAPNGHEPPDGPTGEMSPCTTSQDCTGYATFCQTLQMPNVCLIQGCATGERRCVGSNICCSFASFPLLASTNGICIPAANCMGPGTPVTP